MSLIALFSRSNKIWNPIPDDQGLSLKFWRAPEKKQACSLWKVSKGSCGSRVKTMVHVKSRDKAGALTPCLSTPFWIHRLHTGITWTLDVCSVPTKLMLNKLVGFHHAYTSMYRRVPVLLHSVTHAIFSSALKHFLSPLTPSFPWCNGITLPSPMPHLPSS